MKNSILILLAVLILAACEKKDAPRYTQNSPEIDILKSGISHYNTKNWEAMAANFADTAKVYYNTKKSPISFKEVSAYHGQNDVNFSSRGFLDRDQDYEMVVTDKGETWVNFWGIWEGTLAADNRKIEMPVHLTAQFKDGKIVEEHGYWDNGPLIMAIQEIEAAEKAKSAVPVKLK
ncbi:nuclear transport factor 2 family protein [Rhodonellum sp.]|uniref:nuclear transport factor 2 family protein n=1 Tax=Rhodonellum sp. TaxID=2231180 RepID=UPI00272511DB|nr:nuclear transport factor 2 family protein [Rhodonellum sp.]MDO9554309.1 nuclear transport factor 2 family protein [Rhodonellum sp.]